MAEISEKMRHTLAIMAFDCIKDHQAQSHLSALLVATLFTMQVYELYPVFFARFATCICILVVVMRGLPKQK